MDSIDREIIALLQSNARLPLKALANEVHLSSPAVSARIERLENEGIIEGYKAVLNHEKTGHPIVAFINLDLDPTDKVKFYPYIEKCKNVLECACVTGQYSMLIKVCFESTGALDSFIGELQQFGKTNTQIVFSTPIKPRSIQL
ncbi:MAG: Lrp/AsnC family transcriptional regulator [Clostridia bacterium]|nr:Lrp/AsnC family transcriptional regulator [Clostridia bacterium]